MDFPFFPPGSTQVFDINLLHDLASVSDRHSLDLSLTPSVVLVVFGYYGLPGAVLLRPCTWKIAFFSFVLETLFKACSQRHTYSEGLLQLRSSLTHLLPRGLKSERLWRWIVFVSSVGSDPFLDPFRVTLPS